MLGAPRNAPFLYRVSLLGASGSFPDLCSSVVAYTIYRTRWEQAKAHGTFMSRRRAAFSPRPLRPQEREKVAVRPDEGRGEKNRTCGEVPAGRMRGKGARPTKVYPIAETSHVIRFLSVSICDWPCELPKRWQSSFGLRPSSGFPFFIGTSGTTRVSSAEPER